MSKQYHIVCPDAAETTEANLGEANLQKLNALGSFKLCPGAPASNDEFIQRVQNAHAIILEWSIPDEVLSSAEDLQLISFTGIGASKFVNLELAKSRNITVCNCPGYGDQTVAEHALALLFAAAKNVIHHDSNLRNGTWDQSKMGFEVAGSTVGVIGFGGIGQQFARLCHALGARVLVWTANPDKYSSLALPYDFVELDQLLDRSDVVSIHLAHNKHTERFLDRTKIAGMKPGCFLINTARGEIIDEAALCEALHSGRISGAGLDVFTSEPLEPGDALLNAPNTVLTPHVGYLSPNANRRLNDIAVQNVLDYFANTPKNTVTA